MKISCITFRGERPVKCRHGIVRLHVASQTFYGLRREKKGLSYVFYLT